MASCLYYAFITDLNSGMTRGAGVITNTRLLFVKIVHRCREIWRRQTDIDFTVMYFHSNSSRMTDSNIIFISMTFIQAQNFNEHVSLSTFNVNFQFQSNTRTTKLSVLYISSGRNYSDHN